MGDAGKSGVLKALAQLVQAESRIVVVAPNRIPGGGRAALKAQLGCDATARELLIDAGGGTLFIDGIDRFENPAGQQTVGNLGGAPAPAQRALPPSVPGCAAADAALATIKASVGQRRPWHPLSG